MNVIRVGTRTSPMPPERPSDDLRAVEQLEDAATSSSLTASCDDLGVVRERRA